MRLFGQLGNVCTEKGVLASGVWDLVRETEHKEMLRVDYNCLGIKYIERIGLGI